MRNKTLVAAACAAAFLFGAVLSTNAATSYGPSGLGANLHRRHVMIQATKRAQQGKPVRRSAILWLSGPRATAFRAR